MIVHDPQVGEGKDVVTKRGALQRARFRVDNRHFVRHRSTSRGITFRRITAYVSISSSPARIDALKEIDIAPDGAHAPIPVRGGSKDWRALPYFPLSAAQSRPSRRRVYHSSVSQTGINGHFDPSFFSRVR